jgi:hypothetical protein
MWIISGAFSGVLDPALVEQVMHQEIHQRSKQVIEFWMGLCDCGNPIHHETLAIPNKQE